MNLFPYVTTWAMLAVVAVALAIYRILLGLHEDDTIHFRENEAPAVAAQARLFRKLETIERWGKALTVVAILYGLAIACVYLYDVWQQGSRLSQ